MEGNGSVEMSMGEIDSFVGRKGTCVLSLARDGVPYSIPVSYGYDDSSGVFYFRLGFTEDSEKKDFLEEGAKTRVVLYDKIEGDWMSVIAKGNIESIDDEDMDVDVVRQLSRAEIPLLGIWEDPMEEIEFTIYKLFVDEITGRKTN